MVYWLHSRCVAFGRMCCAALNYGACHTTVAQQSELGDGYLSSICLTGLSKLNHPKVLQSSSLGVD